MTPAERKREAFCQAVARGLSGAKAAEEAGYGGSGTSTRLMQRPEVKARIAELDAVVEAKRISQLEKMAPTRDWVLRELVENVYGAKEAKDRASVNRGLELIGKEMGMFVQRSMVIDSPLQRLPADKLVAVLALIEQTITAAEQPRQLEGPTIDGAHTDLEAVDVVTDDDW